MIFLQIGSIFPSFGISVPGLPEEKSRQISIFSPPPQLVYSGTVIDLLGEHVFRQFTEFGASTVRAPGQGKLGKFRLERTTTACVINSECRFNGSVNMAIFRDISMNFGCCFFFRCIKSAFATSMR